MRFTKMHGLGNCYVYVNCFAEQVADPRALAIAVSDRNTGVGSDGLILICPSKVADARMEMYNLDGSRGQMCGNGIRCVAKYVHDHGIAARNPLRIETDAGILTLNLTIADGRVRLVRVDMGEPRLRPEDMPVSLPADQMIDRPIQILGRPATMTCVSMGNPHVVVYGVPLRLLGAHLQTGVGPASSRSSGVGPASSRSDCSDVSSTPGDGESCVRRLEIEGRKIEGDPMFPQRTNVHFVEVHSPSEVTMLPWERGSGATQACGTGACAVAVAGVLTGRNSRAVTVHLPGGDLAIEWPESDNHVYMTGPAVEIFSGDWNQQ